MVDLNPFKKKKPANSTDEALIAPNAPSDEKPVLRVGLLMLALGFGGFVLWATFAPLDEGVPAPATVAVDTQRKPVQHQAGGIVGEVLVREAQSVKVGEVLIKLDDAYSRASFEALRKQYLALRSQESRLIAEQQNAAEIEFHSDLLKNSSDPVVESFIAIESKLFVTRRAALKSEIGMLKESSGALEEELRGNQAQLEGKDAQYKLVVEQLKGTRDLAQEGYLPRNKLLEEERLAADLKAMVNNLQASSAKIRRNISEQKLKILQHQQNFQRELETKLADVKRELEPVVEKLRAATIELDRTLIRAPVSGIVVGLAIQTVSGVIPPGAKIMDIVPEDERLLLEAQIPPHIVDRILVGMPADIRFQGFSDLPHLVIQGKLVSISADRMTDPVTHLPYFLGRVEVTSDGLRKLGNNRIQPGMGADVVIKTGERTFLTYLLKPLLRRLSTAITEK